MSDLEVVAGYRCSNCLEWSEEEGGPLYECSSCGTTFNADNSADGSSNRCPDCNKFAAKLGDNSCVQCEEGEISEEDGFLCPDCGIAYDTESGARACCTEVAS